MRHEDFPLVYLQRLYQCCPERSWLAVSELWFVCIALFLQFSSISVESQRVHGHCFATRRSWFASTRVFTGDGCARGRILEGRVRAPIWIGERTCITGLNRCYVLHALDSIKRALQPTCRKRLNARSWLAAHLPACLPACLPGLMEVGESEWRGGGKYYSLT